MINSVIIGAGKIGRGFIAQMLFRAHEPFCFVEKSPALTQAMRRRGSYQILVAHVPERNITVSGFEIYEFEDQAAVDRCVTEADDIFTAIGGKNLPGIAQMLAHALKARFAAGVEKPLNIITCENWVDPAKQLYEAVAEKMG